MKNRNSPLHSSPAARGFTLVEILVVIVIIASIAALSILGTARIRDQARKVTSLRNLSQLQVANASYAADHAGGYVPIYAYDDKGVRTGNWYQDEDFVANLIGEILDSSGKQTRNVPPSILDPKAFLVKRGLSYSIAASYGMNDNGIAGVHGPNIAPAHHINRVPNPSLSMAFATATDFRITYGSRFKWKGVEGKTSDGALAYRYDNKALVVYFDGHVGEVSQSDLRAIDKSKGGAGSSFWNPRAN